MKQKLIITLWKAHLIQQINCQQISCRLTYNSSSKSSKQLKAQKSLQWKQTFIFPLSKQQQPLTIQFIPLKKHQQIHYSKDNITQTISIAKAQFNICIKSPKKGTLPIKLDIIDENSNIIGKLFIQYEILKTEITYMIEKIIDYKYILKLSNFKITFLRDLKKIPIFYLKFIYGNGKILTQKYPFSKQGKQYYYNNYPIKFHIDKQIQIQIQLEIKQNQHNNNNNNNNDYNNNDYNNNKSIANQSLKSGGKLSLKSYNNKQSDIKSQVSSIGKKNTFLDLDFNTKIIALLRLDFQDNVKINKKISLVTPYKNTNRQIGNIQFQIQTVFKTLEEKKIIEEEKKNNINVSFIDKTQNIQIKEKKKKQNQIQPSNGNIIVNTIMGKLQYLDNDIIKNKNISIQLILGKQLQQSSILQKPGNQLIFIDQFQFKRTWEQTIKIILQIHNQNNQKIPTLFATVNLRDLFQQKNNKISGKKVKIFDQNKQYKGTFTLQMQYKQEQKKIIKTKNDKSILVQSKISKVEDVKQVQKMKKRQQINQRMKQKQRMKEQAIKQQRSLSKVKDRQIFTISQALDLNNLILPPLKSLNSNPYTTSSTHRYSTLSPSPPPSSRVCKIKSSMIYNNNGNIKFSQSPRFKQQQKSGGSFLLIRQSDFDGKRKKGASIGYGNKYDFTKDKKNNPGIGKYQIQTLWDKYG